LHQTKNYGTDSQIVEGNPDAGREARALQEAAEGIAALLAFLFIGAVAAISLGIAWVALRLILAAVRGLKEGRLGRYDRVTQPVTFWALAIGWPLLAAAIFWGLGSMLWTIARAANSN
jgi:hypothetical protein